VTTRILGISGSLRQGSLNTRLLQACVGLLPDDVTLEIATLRDVPLYDGDVEAQGIPSGVVRLKDQIAGSDGLLIVSPEYNHTMPGVLKNAIDWCSRPPQDIGRVFKGRPVALIGASPGAFGTARGQHSWLAALRAVQLRPYFEHAPFYLERADHAFDDQGALQDAKKREHLQGFLAGFAHYVRQGRA
jgi:chromate reductase, NAD(P)H dehydrogenase (quinone)